MNYATRKNIQGDNQYGGLWRRFKRSQNLSRQCRGLCNHFATVLVVCGLRDYGVEGQIGLEKTPEEYVAKMVEVFREVRRVLKPTGTLWLNLGDSYWANRAELCEMGGVGRTAKCGREQQGRAGQGKHSILKPKDLCGIPWRVAFALQADGWWLRQDIIWAKPNPMPESVTDRCTKAHEYVFLMSKSQHYYFDNEAIKEDAVETNDARPRMGQGPNTIYNQKRKDFDKSQSGGGTNVVNHSGNSMGIGGKKNKRTVWQIATQPFSGAHFATFPEKLIEPMIKAGCPQNGVCLDPFMGSGTVGLVAKKLGVNYVGIELNPKYIKMADARIGSVEENLFKKKEV